MTDVEHLRHLLQFKDSDRSEYETLVDGIEFALAELRVYDQEIPATLEEAKQLYNVLIPKLKPPTPDQLRELNRLLVKTGGTLNGTLVSGAATQLLIDYLRNVKSDEPSNEYDPYEEDYEITLDEMSSDKSVGIDQAATNRMIGYSMILPLLIGLFVGWIPIVGTWVFGAGLIVTLLAVVFGIFAGWDWDIRFLTWVGYVTFGTFVSLMVQT